MICGADVLCEVVVLDTARTHALTGIVPKGEVYLALAIKKLRAMGARNVVIALGEEGIAVCVGQEITLLPEKTATADDAFVQRLEQRLTAGETLVTAVRFCAKEGSLSL